MTEYDDLVARLRSLGSGPVDPAVASAHLTAMAAAGAGRARRVGRFQRLKVASAFAAGIVLGGTSLASAGVMGDTAQNKVADAAEHVGVNLPGGTERVACDGLATGANHGQYVKAHKGDADAARSDCGKPVSSVGTSHGTDENRAGDDVNGNGAACKPPWAGKMTKAERDAARAGADAWRAAHTNCAADEAGHESDDAVENDEPSSTTPSTAAVTPPGGGHDDNAGVPADGSIPGRNEQGDDHRTDTTGAGAAPSTLPSPAQGEREGEDEGPENADHASTTTTTALP